ncbi:Plasma membrane low glucose sensor, partial [Nowakowskiella sp. JEL0078]
MGGSVIATIGGFLQAFTVSVPMLFIGRFIAGLAIGAFSAMVPIYMSECIVYTFRGSMVTGQQFMIVLGVAAAYWTDFITYKFFTTNDWQWRGPLIVQGFLGILIFVSVLPLPRSPRWLLSKGHNEQSLASLARLRMLPEDNPYVQTEFEEMQWSVQREREIGTSSVIEVITSPVLRKRLLVISALNAYQQLTGTNGVNYYAPQFYQQLQVGGTDSVLLLQGFYGLLKLVMTIPAVFGIEKLGRRKLLMIGASIMALAMLALGTLFAVTTGGDPKNVTVLASNKSLGILGVFFIWSFVVGYNASWGPVTWVVSSEVFPLRVRTKAMAVTATVQWLANTLS